MAEITKHELEPDHISVTQKPNHNMTDAQRSNAVGYDEYLEAMDLEVTEKEVLICT